MWKVESLEGFYSEITPAASMWLPWFGRTSRWWFEVSGPGDEAEGIETHYYTFDGGAFTLRRCIFRAENAAFKAWQKWGGIK